MEFTPTSNIGENIRTLRTLRGDSQEALASRLCVTAQAVSRWESGRTTPDISMLPSLAGYFGVTIDSLMGFDPSEKARSAAKIELSRAMANDTPEKTLAACRSAHRLYPNDLDITMLCATALFSRAAELALGYESDTESLTDEARALTDEGIAFCLRVLKEYPTGSHSEIIKGSARMILMRFYKLRGEYTAASQTAQLMPILSATRDFNLPCLLEKSELPIQLDLTLTQLGGLFIQLLIAGVYAPGEHHGLWKLTRDECRRFSDALEAVYALNELADVRTNLIYLLINLVWAKRLCESGESEAAFKRLTVAVDCLDFAKSDSILRNIPSTEGMIGFEPGDDRLSAAELIAAYFERGCFVGVERLDGFGELTEKLKSHMK